MTVNNNNNNDGKSEEEKHTRSALLSRRFLYQNRQTGNVSATHLTAQQLCRILCPPASLSSSSLQQRQQNITPDTQILALEVDGISYSKDGWKTAKTVPVLREAVALWHYEDNNGAVQGPVSCRELAALVVKSKRKSPAEQQSSLRVYNSEITTNWQTVEQLPYLEAAIQAFDTTIPPPSSLGLETTDGPPPINQHQQQQQYDPSVMAYEAADDLREEEQANEDDVKEKVVQAELEAFLSSTEHLGPKHHKNLDDSEDVEAYESDGGTRYVKDPRTGKWIHEALAPKSTTTTEKRKGASTGSEASSSTISTTQPAKKKRRKKAKFAARNARCWIYVTGLPSDTTVDEVSRFFSKAGIIDLDPETQKPKIKLYRHKQKEEQEEEGRPNAAATAVGPYKGDASICYARPESVDLALTLLDEAPFRPQVSSSISGKEQQPTILCVERAKFEQHGDTFHEDGRGGGGGRRVVSNAKRKVAKLAVLQAMDWDEGEISGGRLTGGRKGLRIIVLKHLFHPSELAKAENEDEVLAKLEKDLRTQCEQWGVVEKITVFSKHPDGVVIVKFAQPFGASQAIKELHGQEWRKDVNSRRIEASYWDGVTDFTVRDEEKEEKETKERLEEFGNWLDGQAIPEELQLQTEE